MFVMCDFCEVEEKADILSYSPQYYCRISNCGGNFRRLHVGYLFTGIPCDDAVSSSVSVV